MKESDLEKEYIKKYFIKPTPKNLEDFKNWKEKRRKPTYIYRDAEKYRPTVI
jgi:hypothetical protein